jgi:hypothetical protein
MTQTSVARTPMFRRAWSALMPLALVAVAAVPRTPCAHADNKRLNDGVVANVYTIQHQAGCTNDVKINPQLQFAAQWHTLDVLNNRRLDGDVGSDGSTPQDRANAAGFHGTVAETVAINPALAISGIEILNQWYYNPAYLAIMRDCSNTAIGVWWPCTGSHSNRSMPPGAEPKRAWTQAPTMTQVMRSNTASTGSRGSCEAYTRHPLIRRTDDHIPAGVSPS